MKKLILFFAILASFGAIASDLDHDLAVGFAPMQNPFMNFERQPLDQNIQDKVGGILQKCAYQEVRSNFNSNHDVLALAKIKKNCAGIINESSDGNRLDVKVSPYQKMIIVGWDGLDSDGGDEQAIGIYNQDGNRLAVYPDVFEFGNVISGVMHAFDKPIEYVRE